MILTEVNYLAVLVAAIVSMAIGFVWYGPAFGKQWMKLVGKTQKDMEAEKAKMPQFMGIGLVAALVTAYVLALFVNLADAATIAEGLQVGFWVWLGFVVTTSLGGFTWSGRPMNLYYLENANHLVAFLVMGAILAVWV